jgi:hypothetical protein
MPSPLRQEICIVCGISFQVRAKKTKTCGRKCGAILRERRTPSPGRKIKEYPPALIEHVRELYEAGYTMREVAVIADTSVHVLQRLMPRYGIERRPAINPRQRRENNPSWLGDNAGYSAMHLRVTVTRGRINCCACCDTTDSGVVYHWANLTGHYEDINDYVRLCVPCHRRLDARRRVQLGHGTMRREGEGGGG